MSLSKLSRDIGLLWPSHLLLVNFSMLWYRQLLFAAFPSYYGVTIHTETGYYAWK